MNAPVDSVYSDLGATSLLTGIMVISKQPTY